MILSILDAVGVSKDFSRPIREGEQVLEGGFVVAVGLKSRNASELHVQALVLRTSGITTKAPALVEIWVDMSKPVGSRVTKDQSPECGCPAGKSEKCKHIIAVMLYLARIEDKDLEDLSCTDIEQQWGALKNATLKDYEAKSINELCHVKAKRDVYVSSLPEVTQEMKDRWKTKLMNCAPLSEISLFTSCLRQGLGSVDSPEDEASQIGENWNILQRLLTFRSWAVMKRVRQLTHQEMSSLDPSLLQFYEDHIMLDLDNSVEIAKSAQGSDEWKEARRLRQTANKARSQFTYYVNSKANWDKRFKDVFYSEFKGNSHTIAGLRGEVLGRDIYAGENNCTVFESGLLVRPELPWLGCSVDGTVMDEMGEFRKNIEIKTFKEGQRLTAQELFEYQGIKTVDENGNVKKANDHYAQMQIGMFLTGMDTCDYVVYSEKGNDIVTIPVPFDEDHVFQLCERLVKVYFKEWLPRMQLHHQAAQK